MTCPYAVHRFTKTTWEYEEREGELYDKERRKYDLAYFLVCTESECGAWDKINERCGYNAKFP